METVCLLGFKIALQGQNGLWGFTWALVRPFVVLNITNVWRL